MSIQGMRVHPAMMENKSSHEKLLPPAVSTPVSASNSTGLPLTDEDHHLTAPSLEDRIAELETKLSVLSRLLHRQQSRLTSPTHIEGTPPLATLPVTKKSSKNAPEIPEIGPHKRNLSLNLLFDGNEDEYEKERRRASAPLNSMTPAERQWLQPKILALAQTQSLQSEIELHQARQQEDDAKDQLSSSSTSNETTNSNSLNSVVQDSVRNNWLNYLNSYHETSKDVDELMQEFIRVPGKVESILMFGLTLCIDCFLYMITILPIRFVWSCLLLCGRVTAGRRPAPFRFHRRHTYQLVQVFILYSIYRYVLSAISIGKLYHWIRGQSMIKLYVLIAMVEVFDRLFSSLGQDCLDSLYWTTVNRPKSLRMVVSVAVVWVYATLHSLILFIHVETLNVAVNSADQALLTLLISGNFAEIKSTVFKKYNKPALFKITASDICERFKLGLFLSLVLLMNLCQGMEKGQLLDYLRICGYVWCAELLSDWIKHSFITKFNFLPSKVYPEYALLLAGDVTGIGHEGVNLDHSHAVVKRIGFAQIPLVCLMFRLLKEALKYAKRNPVLRPYFATTWYWTTAYVLAVWLVLLIIKLILGGLLQRISLAKLRAVPEILSPSPMKKKKE